MVSLTIVLIGGFFWRSSYLEQARESEKTAELALEAEDYHEALKHWNQSHQSYRTAFHKDGQFSSLLQLSACNAALHRYDEALLLVDRAEQLKATADSAQSRLDVYRSRGFYNLELAEDRLSSETNKDALRYAESAIQSLTKGEADTQDVAHAHCVAARALAEQLLFDKARQHLELSRELNGESESHRLAAESVDELDKLFRQAKQEKAKRERYIPDKDLDLIGIAKTIKARRAERYQKADQSSYAYSYYQPYRSIRSEANSYTRKPRPSVKTDPYPKANSPVHRRYTDTSTTFNSDYRYNNYNRYPVPNGHLRQRSSSNYNHPYSQISRPQPTTRTESSYPTAKRPYTPSSGYHSPNYSSQSRSTTYSHPNSYRRPSTSNASNR